MKKKELLMGIIMSVIISAVMGALASFLILRSNPQAAQGTPVPMMYLTNILLSVVVGVIVALVIPLGKLGRGLASKAGANPPSLKFNLLNSLPLSVGNTLIVSLILSLVGVVSARGKMPPEALAQVPPLPVMWLGSWAKLLIPTLVASYVISVVLSPLISRLVGIGGPGGRPQGRPDPNA
ncbi:MAG: hypothetical protein IJ757_05705 [Clostridiales bacterium]|nr:hypothetical protein [Clostridiales bacterium]